MIIKKFRAVLIMIFPWTKIYSVRMAVMMKRLCLRLVTDSSFFFSSFRSLAPREFIYLMTSVKYEGKKRWSRCLLRWNISIKIKFTSRMKLASNQIQFAHVEFQPGVITYKIAQRIKISICMKIACLYVVMNDNHLRRSQEEELVASFCRSRWRLCVHFYDVVWLV